MRPRISGMQLGTWLATSWHCSFHHGSNTDLMKNPNYTRTCISICQTNQQARYLQPPSTPPPHPLNPLPHPLNPPQLPLPLLPPPSPSPKTCLLKIKAQISWRIQMSKDWYFNLPYQPTSQVLTTPSPLRPTTPSPPPPPTPKHVSLKSKHRLDEDSKPSKDCYRNAAHQSISKVLQKMCVTHSYISTVWTLCIKSLSSCCVVIHAYVHAWNEENWLASRSNTRKLNWISYKIILYSCNYIVLYQKYPTSSSTLATSPRQQTLTMLKEKIRRKQQEQYKMKHKLQKYWTHNDIALFGG